MDLIVPVVAVAAVAVVTPLVIRSQRKAAALREAERIQRLREDEERMRMEKEAREAPPLVAPPDLSGFGPMGERINALLERFERLTTFQDVAVWDRDAEAVADALATAGHRLSAMAAAMDAAVQAHANADEPRHIRAARIATTKAHAKQVRELLGPLAKNMEALLERIDMTPDDKKAQQALLRELRAEKKELAAQKREARASMADIKREARIASANAGQVSQLFDWDGYNGRVAAIQRRRIRAAKESLLGPHEDAVAALDRQILSTDRRIAWVQRFGDAPEEQADEAVN